MHDMKTLDELMAMANDYATKTAAMERGGKFEDSDDAREDLESALRELIADAEMMRHRVIELQTQLQYKPPEVVSSASITACNCYRDGNEPGKKTAGWYCPAHGQMF